ncbi:MAG: sulfur carrier protein ThiS [Planctomycetaceae bacterium]|jgi:thiamine biosynthesis protein ThiS|nr:sulfur carrier protein ThiS [Planctomycetaceae bacterium]
MQIEIRLNGEAKSVPEGTSVAALVAGLGLRPEVVAVERNGRIVRRAEHASTALQPGDELEVVTLVGGG